MINQKEIRITSIQAISNGDYIYEIELPLELQNKITASTAELEMTTEEYLRKRITDKVGSSGIKRGV